MTTQPIPPGYMQDARGRLIPEQHVKPIDKVRHDLVLEIVGKARKVSDAIGQFKSAAFSDIAAFVQLSAEQYGAAIGGTKGNVSLLSYDGRFKVQRAISDKVSFGEQLQAAKALIDSCITDWSDGARPELRLLVNDAFQVDKQGNVNTERVLGLRRLDIRDPKWGQAMQAINDAVMIVGSKTYIRVYERVGDTDEYRPIALDVAGA